MARNELNHIYKFLIGSPILLQLASVLTSLNISSIPKVEYGKSAALNVIKVVLVRAVGYVAWATHLIFQYFPNSMMEQTATTSESLHSDNAMHRALCQVFALVNDTPVSSEKYEYARTLVDKIIVENMAHGDDMLWDTNKVAVQAAFSRTLKMLALALEVQQQQEVKGGSWSWSLARSFFSRGVLTYLNTVSIEKKCTDICRFSLPVAKFTLISDLPSILSGSNGSSVSAVAEKLAQELLWISEKLKECSSVNEAARMWSFEYRLAKLSVSAHPRVQASLLRVSVLLLRELALFESSDSFIESSKANLLQLWLPLFCHAKSGLDCPSFTPSEKVEILRSLEQNIKSLSLSEQELVLACWLKEYIASASEWPNLQHCFENWCSSIRKSTISSY